METVRKLEDSVLRERLIDVSDISTEKAQILCRRLDGRFKCKKGKTFIVFTPSDTKIYGQS